jgi:hypothetical protein
MTKRYLDKRAFFILMLFVVVAIASFAWRTWQLSQIDLGPTASAMDTIGGIWVFSSKVVIRHQPDGARGAALVEPLARFGLRGPIPDAVAYADGVLFLNRDGALHFCRAVGDIVCEAKPLSGGIRAVAGKLALSQDQRLLAVAENNANRVHLFDMTSGTLLSSSKDNASLDHPNRPHFTRNQLVLANTGKYSLVAWPRASDGGVDLTQMPTRTLKLVAQPYFHFPSADGWVVLQAGSMLASGEVVFYDRQGSARSWQTSLRDPQSMYETHDGSVLLIGFDDRKLVRVVKGQAASAPELDPINQRLADQAQDNKGAERLAMLGLIGVVVSLIAPILLLALMGYDLNQPIGKGDSADTARNTARKLSTLDVAQYVGGEAGVEGGDGSNGVVRIIFDRARSLKRARQFDIAIVAGGALFAAANQVLFRDIRISATIFGVAVAVVVIGVVARRSKRFKWAPFDEFAFFPTEMHIVRGDETRRVSYESAWLYEPWFGPRIMIAAEDWQQYFTSNAMQCYDGAGLLAELQKRIPRHRQFSNWFSLLLSAHRAKARWALHEVVLHIAAVIGILAFQILLLLS